MFDAILKRMREKIRAGQYVMTLHAEEEMDDDELTIFDVDRGVLAGEIVERQKTARQVNGSVWSKVKPWQAIKSWW